MSESVLTGAELKTQIRKVAFANRKAQENKDDEQPKHHQGDLRIGHVIWSFSAMLAFWIKRSSVSKTSSSASSQ